MSEKHFPAWLNDAVFYEIYPQSFRDSNADGIGDLPGITERLAYIQDLGCTALWLNPCFVSPFYDAGYDVADYCTVAPRYGTNEDMRALFAAAHARGMHVLLDLVPGHTSFEHPWFRASMRAEKNEFTDRYIWTDSAWKSVPGMETLRGISDRDGGVAVNFFSTQPSLNYGFYRPDPDESWQQGIDDPGPQGTIRAMIDVMRFWLSMGCDGFRVDMAGSLVKGDEAGKGTIRVWQQVRRFLDEEFPEAAMISEWSEPDKSIAGGFHMDFLLHFGPTHYLDLFRCEKPYFAGEGDVSAFVESYQGLLARTEGQGLICLPSGNHDMERLAWHRYGNDLPRAFGFLFTMPGAPFLYYGDEFGMRYVEGLTSHEGGFNRTGARTPMQWDGSLNAGFSAAAPEKLYLPIDPAADRPNAAAAEADPDSLLHEVKRLIRLRHAHPALQSRGAIEFVFAEKNAYPLAYIRSGGGERLLVVVNPSAREASFEAPAAPAAEVYASGAPLTCSGRHVSAPAHSFAVWQL